MAFRVLQGWTTVVRPRTRGVKCVLLDGEGRALFVRHTYGARESWELPGGAADRGESPADAAAREAVEELGFVPPGGWRELAVFQGIWFGKRERIDVYAADWDGRRLRMDAVEIADAAWFALTEPPAPLGPSTRAALLAVARGARAGAAPPPP